MLGNLFTQNAGRLERNGRDGGRHVPERVQSAVGGTEFLRGLGNHGAHRLDNVLKLRYRQLALKSRNAFQLVNGAARVSQAAARHHGDAHRAQRGDCGCQEEGNLVANATGGVLVHEGFSSASSATGNRIIVTLVVVCVVLPLQPHSGIYRARRQCGRFLRRQAVQANGHEPGRHVVVFYCSTTIFAVFGNPPLQLGLRVRTKIEPTRFDKGDGVHCEVVGVMMG